MLASVHWECSLLFSHSALAMGIFTLASVHWVSRFLIIQYTLAKGDFYVSQFRLGKQFFL